MKIIFFFLFFVNLIKTAKNAIFGKTNKKPWNPRSETKRIRRKRKIIRVTNDVTITRPIRSRECFGSEISLPFKTFERSGIKRNMTSAYSKILFSTANVIKKYLKLFFFFLILLFDITFYILKAGITRTN